jgi:tetratricopeptide (TPR) repeat protein
MAKKKKTNTEDHHPKYGAALIIDLARSSFAWDQNQDIARKMIDLLAELTDRNLTDFGGEKVNFTGDGFLFVFTVIDNAIIYCSRLIEAWEPHRRDFIQQYFLPPDSKFFIIRSGVEFGIYYQWREDKVGGALNRAQRCEAAGKKCIGNVQLPQADPSTTHFAVFVSKAAWDYSSKNILNCQRQEETTFSGFDEIDPTSGEYKESPQILYAVWPKQMFLLPRPPPPADQYVQAAEAQSALDSARTMLAEANRYVGLSMGQLDATSKMLIDEALEKYRLLSAQVALPMTLQVDILVSSCGSLLKLSRRVSPKEKLSRLHEAEHFCREALRICVENNLHDDRGPALNALGNTLSSQAYSSIGRDRAQLLAEAIIAYRSGLDVYTQKSIPARHAKIQTDLARALGNQAILFKGRRKAELLEEAVVACSEALKVRTLAQNPQGYAETQNILGNTLLYQSGLLAGRDSYLKLEQAIEAYREALRIRTLEDTPADYATTQKNLGKALRDQALLLSKIGKARKLKESVAAYREALKIRNLTYSPGDYASTQNNLGDALRDQAALIKGMKKADKLEEAVRAYREALQVRSLLYTPEDYAMTQNSLGTALGGYAELLGGVSPPVSETPFKHQAARFVK